MRTMVRVAFQPDLPPYQFMDSEGNLVGVHLDILDSIARQYSLDVRYVPMPTNTACFEALLAGEVDVVLGIRPSLAYAPHVAYTTMISQSQVCLIAPNDLAANIKQNLATDYYRVGYENGIMQYSALGYHRNLHSCVVPNQRETLGLLLSERVHAIIGVRNSLVYQIESAGLGRNYTIVNNYLVPVEHVMAVRSNDRTLLQILNHGIGQSRISGDYEKIHDKWIEPQALGFPEFARKVVAGVLVLCCGAGLIAFVSLRISRALKRQVGLKTRELSEANSLLQRQVTEIRNLNELRNQIVMDHPYGIIVFDTNFIITECNVNACQIIEHCEPPIGQSVLSIELLRPLLERNIDQWFDPEAELHTEDLVVRDSRGDTVIYRCDTKRLYHSTDEIRGIFLSIKNVTVERRKHELFYERERNRSLNQIVAGLAHEIRNPLTSIKAFVELVPTKKGNQRFLDQMARYLPEEIDRMGRMVRDLVDYVKPLKHERQPISVGEILLSCSALMRYSLSPRIDLVVETEDGLQIHANPSQFRQIMVNLILNGAEAIEERLLQPSERQQFRIMVCARSEDHDVVITVRDEGYGMGTTVLRRAFEPYFTTKPNGTGLGLSISRQYVEENGGMLSVTSREGEYTEVVLRFRRYEI